MRPVAFQEPQPTALAAQVLYGRCEASSEEGEDLVARGDGWLAGFVDEMGCHDAMGARHVARAEWCKIVVRSAVRKHAPYETIAKSGGVCGEAFCPAESVTSKR
jgi:hypothetical protein